MKGMRVKSTIIYLLSISILLFILTLLLFSPFLLESNFFFDTPQYWSTVQLFLQGKNPYYPQDVLFLQKTIQQFSMNQPMLSWNPPWIIPVIFLFFNKTYYGGLPYFAFVLLSLLPLSSALLNWIFFKNLSFTRIFSVFIFLFPLTSFLANGNLDPILTFGVALLFFGITSEVSIAAALGLFFLSLKPHFVVFWLYYLIAAYILTGKKWIHRTGLYFTFSIVFFCLVFWKLVMQWVQALFNGILNPEVIQKAGAVSILQWKPDTLSGMIRWLTLEYLGIDSILIPMIIFLLGIIYISYKILLHRNNLFNPSFCLEVLATSIVVSPYGWLHDYVMLLPFHLILVDRWIRFPFFNKDFCFLTFVFIIPHTLGFLISHFEASKLSFFPTFFWFPTVMIFCWWVSERVYFYKKNRSID